MSRRGVLVVDDDHDMRDLSGTCLKLVGGFAVDTAASGQEALHLLEAALSDALLLDVMMPDLDGLALVIRLRQNPRTRTLPVVLLTAKHHVRSRPDWDQLHIAGAIGKPFDP